MYSKEDEAVFVMTKRSANIVPSYDQLIVPTFKVLKNLGGSGNNEEILEGIVEIMNLPDYVVDQPHNGDTARTEVAYRAAWARTYLKKAGIITNSGRSFWVICPEYINVDTVDAKEIVRKVKSTGKTIDSEQLPTKTVPVEEKPDEDMPWRVELADILLNMNPYAFERLAQRVLRQCGFSQVEVTKKSGDGGIDGFGKLKINEIITINVAFQCKRYKTLVGASDIRDFRGSLTRNIEKGVFITTSGFTKAAKEEAINPGKIQIDLLDGEELIDILIQKRIGVEPIEAFKVDRKYFETM